MILALRTDGPTAQAWLLPENSTAPQAEASWDSGRRMADELLSNLEAFMRESNAPGATSPATSFIADPALSRPCASATASPMP